MNVPSSQDVKAGVILIRLLVLIKPIIKIILSSPGAEAKLLSAGKLKTFGPRSGSRRQLVKHTTQSKTSAFLPPFRIWKQNNVKRAQVSGRRMRQTMRMRRRMRMRMRQMIYLIWSSKIQLVSVRAFFLFGSDCDGSHASIHVHCCCLECLCQCSFKES
ncbi:hypothetical protein DFH05DRAFT_1509440 [Lentinula detonsa]|uniref:Uncharacterized protein n=1 Tax=Lentinula detonsa TaxID=2804962 RepID=A0A9W8NRB6_9AGAR|nr:hypothetical protein DFH05DRAFT_1514992 [Lentinula detonsa]KAJ3740592.1 hypothetical protein DFH05DRAFT_1509440 [Lentinula detonsa]